MAKATRAERRARRLAQAGAEPAVAGVGGRGGGKPPVRLAPEPEPRPERRARPGGGLLGFARESVAELRKVEWPTQNHLIQGTVVVIVACVVMGTYLYFADQIFNKLVSKLLLGQ
jgi:preprotein translocase subunit SecE